MTLQQPPMDRQVAVQIERLVDEDGGLHSHDEIERMAQEVASEHADAPVHQYVPNLVYNEVKTKLVGEQAEAADDAPGQRMTASDQPLTESHQRAV
jgi:hypothetical protein